MTVRRLSRLRLTALVAAGAALLALSGCAGEGPSAGSGARAAQGGTLNIDFATYNPLSLLIKEKGWLEQTLAGEGVTVNWIQSAGSNKANEALKSGALDVGSTAGSAALLARANGSDIHSIVVYSQPEWSALVVRGDSTAQSVAQLAGKKIAATSGTDPYFFLVQALTEAGLSTADVEIVNLQHADGWAALQRGDVDAWAGLDPIMAGAEAQGARLIYRNVRFNSYGLLNATASFLAARPELAQRVVDVYEHARGYALAHLEETASILAKVAGLEPAVASAVVTQRSNLGVTAAPGDEQRAVLAVIAPILLQQGTVQDGQAVDEALRTLLEPRFALRADPSIVS